MLPSASEFSSILTSLADSKHSLHDKYPVLYQNKFEKQCISLVFYYKNISYNDARSSECHIIICTYDVRKHGKNNLFLLVLVI